MTNGKKAKAAKSFLWMRTILVVLMILLIVAYGFLRIYMSFEKQRIGAEELKETVVSVAGVFNQREYYLMPDTAYMVKLEPGFYRSERALQNYPNKELLRSLNDIRGNIEKGVKYNPLIQSVYVMLEDPAAPYVIANGASVRKMDMHDTQWMDACRGMAGTKMIEWRELPLSYTRSTKAVTHYTRVQSVDWIDGRLVGGYIVVNYHFDAILNIIRADLRYGETAVLYHRQSGASLVVKRDEAAQNEGLLQELLQTLREGDAKAAKPVFFQKYGQLVHIADVEDTGLTIALAKEDVQMNRFMDNIQISFVSVLMVLLGLMLLFYLYSHHQYRRYIAGVVRLIHALDENQGTETTERLPNLTVQMRDTEDLQIIAEKLLSHTMDINELRNTLMSEKMLRSEAEMLYGHAQINSHFLLNTLDSIYWASVRSRGFDAGESRMIEKLCRILKYALDASSMTATLRQELEYAEEYLDIQQIRRNRPIQVTWSIPDAALDASVSKLIMQPILENSIQHGAHKDKEAGMAIHISAFLNGQDLHVRMEDNGCGLPEEVMEEMMEQFMESKPVRTRHIGMANVNRRIQVLYGSGYGIRLSRSSLGGLCAELVMKTGDGISSQ